MRSGSTLKKQTGEGWYSRWIEYIWLKATTVAGIEADVIAALLGHNFVKTLKGTEALKMSVLLWKKQAATTSTYPALGDSQFHFNMKIHLTSKRLLHHMMPSKGLKKTW